LYQTGSPSFVLIGPQEAARSFKNVGDPLFKELQTTICTDCFAKHSILDNALQFTGIESLSPQ